MKMKPDDAYALRMALEPLTYSATAEDHDQDSNGIFMASIAISLRRIADALEPKPERLKTL